MAQYKLASNIGLEFLREINKYPEIQAYCCSCFHINGECPDFAKAGTCKSYNAYKDQLKEKCVY